ncbi:hypothetical protein [Clostridium transplantifaecale]|uniref:hypothetical protein n=1 Tax=Clostridium transplantifaecale TaxID=2479838 RepID=UPI000F6441FD|nr:hypothetical protein [Clostridium transplantifaecale]
MNIIIEDFGGEKGRKILISDGPANQRECEADTDAMSDESQRIEYMNAHRAVFHARQWIKEEQKARETGLSDPIP